MRGVDWGEPHLSAPEMQRSLAVQGVTLVSRPVVTTSHLCVSVKEDHQVAYV
jgi:hypothetical protein